MKRFASKELSGALKLILTILFIQTLVFVFKTDSAEDKTVVNTEVKTTAGTKADRAETAQKSEVPKRDPILQPEIITKKRAARESGAGAPKLFSFDPNSVSAQELVMMGMTQKQAEVFVNYRDRGGVFRSREDFAKVYSVSDSFYEKVKEYIVIENIQTHKSEKKLIIELNEADSADLLQLRGIGPYYASKIIKYRERLGGFVMAEQLKEISGIDSVRFEMFANNIMVDTSKVQKRDIANSGYPALASNPYIGSYLARSIVRYAESNPGQSITIAELLVKNIIRRELYNILNLYFR